MEKLIDIALEYKKKLLEELADPINSDDWEYVRKIRKIDEAIKSAYQEREEIEKKYNPFGLKF